MTSAPPPIVTALLCAKTEPNVELIVHQFKNALHRLNCAITDSYLLPGGGAFEAACVRILRQKADELEKSGSSANDLNMPYPMITSWLSGVSLLRHWRPNVYRVFADGFLQYTANVIANCSPGLNRYMAMVEADKMVQESSIDRVCMESKVMDEGRSKIAAWRRSLEIMKMAFVSLKVEQ